MKIVVFSTGRRMYEYKMRGAFDGFEIVAYCDNDSNKHGKEIDGVKIVPPSELNRIEYDKIYVASDLYYENIKEQLLNDLNIPEEKIVKVETEINKYDGELSFWKAYHHTDGFNSEIYRDFILGVAGETDDSLFNDKVVVDFGCGPQGSLAWTDAPKIKIGVDVLATKYFDNFKDELLAHDMVYVTSSEKSIPLPSSFADILITLNSLDHVYNLKPMVEELLRIIKPDGILLGEFNLNEPVTECEPQTLTIDILNEVLFKHFKNIQYRLNGKILFEGKDINSLKEAVGDNQAVLYVRASN